MKVVILAAGKGSRLDPSENHQPKTLTRLANGKSILANQLDAIRRYISLDQVIVVVGFHKEAIMEEFPDLLYVYNIDYAVENTAKSLLRALKKLDDDVIWINGDVVFHPSVLEEALAQGKNGMVVNKQAVGEEEVKYRADANGRLLEVSKQVSHPQGEALGINFITRQDLTPFKRNLRQCNNQDYFEKAIELSIIEGLQFWAIPVESNLCAEIDFPEDLSHANDLIKHWA